MNRKNTGVKGKKKILKPIGWFIGLFLLLVLIGFVIFYADMASRLNHVELDPTDLAISFSPSSSPTDDPNDKTITNIALFGVDYREGDGQSRSDAIMILSIDRLHNKIKISSLMRDSYVAIDGYENTKLGHAYAYGGPQLAVKTLNQNFGLNITEFASVNFQQMAKIIDAVDGIEIDISEEERINANQSIREQSKMAELPDDPIEKAGLQVLNGTQAVAYARIRYVGNADFDRVNRQRVVMEKLFHKALNLGFSQSLGFAKELLPATETSLDINEILGHATVMMRELTFESARFPVNEDLIGEGSIYDANGQQCVNMDLEMTAERLRAFIYDDVNPEN